MEIIDKRSKKAKETDFKAGDIVEFWNGYDDENEHAIGLVLNGNEYVILKYPNSKITYSRGDTVSTLSETFDHIRKVNAKLVLED